MFIRQRLTYGCQIALDVPEYKIKKMLNIIMRCLYTLNIFSYFAVQVCDHRRLHSFVILRTKSLITMD